MPPLPVCILLFMACLPMKLNKADQHPYTDASHSMAASGSRRGLPSTPATGNPETVRMRDEQKAAWSWSPYDFSNGRSAPHASSVMGGHGSSGGVQGVSH